MTNQSSANDYAELNSLTTFYKPQNVKEVQQKIQSFLSTQNITISNIDLIITGRNGDIKNDEVYNQLEKSFFNKSHLINYKHLCGEYPTSTAFALWVAANIIKTNILPEIFKYSNPQKRKIERILIYNNYQNIHHSLLLISKA